MFFYIHESGNNCLTNDKLTKISFIYLFGRQGERGEQFHEYLDDHFIHSSRRREISIDLERIHKSAQSTRAYWPVHRSHR